jgi:hypothetical protein
MSPDTPTIEFPAGELPEGARKIPGGLIAFMALCVILSLLSPNPIVGLIGVGVYFVFCKIIRSPTEPQALLFALTYQWIQAFASVLQGLAEGQGIETYLGGESFRTAAVLSLLGLLTLALGIKFGARKDQPYARESLAGGLAAMKQNRLILAWVGMSIVSSIAGKIGAASPSIRQALLAVEVWKWFLVFLIFQRWLVLRKGGIFAAIVFFGELAIGAMGFFSGFKTIFLVTLVATTGVTAITGKTPKFLYWAGAFLVLLMGFWQVVKVPYRQFLSQGERSQTTTASVSDRLEWMKMAIPMVDGKMIALGLESGLRRIAYVEYFGHAIDYVPRITPHTNGQLWFDAAKHPVTPRILFPNKPSINDSDRTNTYTGQFVADASEGTSVSIGYIGESYIDFGFFGMWLPIFAWGAVIGFCYSYVRRKSPHPIFGTGLACCLMLSNVLYMESSNIKLTGGLLSSFLVTAFLLKFFAPWAWRWLTSEGRVDDGSQGGEQTDEAREAIEKIRELRQRLRSGLTE